MILSLLIFLPLLAGVLVFLLNGDGVGKMVAFIASVIIFALGMGVFVSFDGASGMQFIEHFALIPKYNIYYSLGVDATNIIFLFIASCAFAPLYLLVKFSSKNYWATLLLMQSAFFLVILSNDLVLFYAGWELMLLPIFIFIGVFGRKEQRLKAAKDMLYYAIFGSMIMLGAIIYLGAMHFNQFGEFSFAVSELKNLQVATEIRNILFWCFMLAFALKIPLFPFHAWLRDAYTLAPTAATFMLSVVASKVAIFAILRFVLPIFSVEFIANAPILIVLGLFSMLYFGIAAVRSKDFKTVLAYASASHLGLIVAGLFSLGVIGLVGAIYQSLAHAITSGMMLLLVGIISHQLGTRDTTKMGGLAARSPAFALFFAIAMVSSVGLPSTIGFAGELLIIVGLFENSMIAGAVATTSIIISATYMFVVFRRAILQSSGERSARFTGLNRRQIAIFILPVLAIFALGLYSKPFIDKIEPGIKNSFEAHIVPLKGN